MTKTEPIRMFWLEAARLVLKRRTALYVNSETGLPVIDQDAANEFVCALSEQEIEQPDVQERLRQWRGCPLDRTDCAILDMQTANVLVTVFDALKPEQQELFVRMPLQGAASFAWRCVR